MVEIFELKMEDKSEKEEERRVKSKKKKKKIRKDDGIICRGWGKEKIFKGMYVSSCLPEKGTVPSNGPGFWMSPAR